MPAVDRRSRDRPALAPIPLVGRQTTRAAAAVSPRRGPPAAVPGGCRFGRCGPPRPRIRPISPPGSGPNPRAGLLIERAEDRQLAGDHGGALTLLERAITMQGPDTAYALAARAESLFRLGRATEALAGLEALRKHRPFSPVAFHRAAEALETAGEQKLAPRWFDMALARCTDQLAAGGGDQPGLGGSEEKRGN